MSTIKPPPTGKDVSELRRAWKIIGAQDDIDPELRDALRCILSHVASLTARLAVAEDNITTIVEGVNESFVDLDDSIEQAADASECLVALARERGRAA